MCLEATLLSECPFTAIFWADKGLLTRMGPVMSFEIGLAKETLRLVRMDLLIEAA